VFIPRRHPPRKPRPPRPTPAEAEETRAKRGKPRSQRAERKGTEVFGARQIAEIAASQEGLVTRRQLLAGGISDDVIDRRLRRGELHAVHRGVYAVGHPALGQRGRWQAALLAHGPCAVLSHWSAGELWEMVSGHRETIHVTAPGAKRRKRHGLLCHSGRLDTRDCRRHRGMAVTTVSRTLLDLAPELGPDQLTRIYNEARLARLLHERDLADLVDRSAGRPGTPRLRTVLGAGRAGPTRSAAEDRMLRLIRAARLPTPQVNARIAGVEVDLLWRAQRLVAEVDGFAFHSSRAAFERDRRRDAALAGAGLRVLRFSWRQLEREPQSVVAALATGLALGSP
jgi:very-short-patch-repair endonuclease